VSNLLQKARQVSAKNPENEDIRDFTVRRNPVVTEKHVKQ
jgi:hypothetical protein